MKHLATFIIFTTLFLLVPFCLNAYAQTSKAKSPDKEELEVQKFVDSFIQSLEETKDLNQVPERFFVTDFKTRFCQSYTEPDIETSFFNKLDETERCELNTTSFNMSYLGLMYAFSKVSIEEAELSEDEDTDLENIKNLFPPQIITLIRNSKTLNAYLIETEDEDGFGIKFEIKDIETLREFTADSKNLVYAQRIFLNDRSIEKKTNYERNIKEARKAANWYSTKICMKDCEGFPKKTRIFEMRYFPFYFKIVRQNGDLKIFDLFIGVLD